MEVSILNRIFTLLLKENNFSAVTANRILEIKNRIFSGLNPKYTLENQRFDFSFSFRDKLIKGVRFSYNNYKEKKDFINKIMSVCGMFGQRYNVHKLRGILEIMRQGYEKHQTTFGVEWLLGNPHPRFKIYFEELQHYYTIDQRLLKLKEIFALAGFSREKIDIMPNENIAAICIDLLPNGSLGIKTYALMMGVNSVFTNIDLKKFPFLYKKLALFKSCLFNEKRAFYYFTKRFSPDADLISVKIYKIYEVKQISDFSVCIEEIKKLFVKSGEESSLQSHKQRIEIWIVMNGEVRGRKGDSVKILKEGDILKIEKNEKHRMTGVLDSVILEIALGHPLERDEIRYEDKYGRAK